MEGTMRFEYGGLTFAEQDERISGVEDDREFILALLEKNPDLQYDIFSKRYSAHEDVIGYIESKLIERFVSN